MKTWACADVLEEKEIKLIHHYALRILSEIGVKVENKTIREKLAEYGGKIDNNTERVCFPNQTIEKFLAESEPTEEFDPRTMDLSTTTGGYHRLYGTPEGKVVPFTLKIMVEMIKVANALESIDNISDIGTPQDVSPVVAPLYMRYIQWKYVKKPGGSNQIWSNFLSAYIIRMGEIMAESTGNKLSDYARGGIEIISPLRLAAQEAEQMVYFWERGLWVSLGGMTSSGGTAPITLAGTLVQDLAENFFCNLVMRAMYGEKKLWLSMGIGIMDMEKAIYVFGRPEVAMLTLAKGQLARYYKAGFSSCTLCSEAMVPSCELGYQRGMNMLSAFMAGARGVACMGDIAPDEITSSIQLIIDNEFAGMVKKFIRGFVISDETIPFDLMKEVVLGNGVYTGTMHTAERFRTEHWQPKIFGRETYNSWIEGDHKTDVERAKDIYYEIVKKDIEPNFDEDIDKALLKVIKEAEEKLVK